MSYLPKPIGELSRRLRMIFRRHQLDLDLDLEEEMRLNLELRRQQQIESGLSPTPASRAAHRKFGNVAHIKKKSIMTWGSEGLESFYHDAAYGAALSCAARLSRLLRCSRWHWVLAPIPPSSAFSMLSCCVPYP